MASAREAVLRAEQEARLLPGTDERFSGWGVMGLPFLSGDIIATQRFPASSVGPGYRSVWFRDPAGAWSFFADAPPETACTRYFGSVVARAVTCPIVFHWTGEHRLRVEVPEARLVCEIAVGSTPASRTLNGLAGALPEAGWRSPAVLRAMAALAGPLLGAGRLALSGSVPNGQAFIANPRRIWIVRAARLTIDGRVADRPGPISPQAQLGDFRIPQRGLLAIGNAAFASFDPARHATTVCTAAPKGD